MKNILALCLAALLFAGCDRDITIDGIYFPRWMVLAVLTAFPAFFISAWIRRSVPGFDPWWFEVSRLSVWAVLFFALEIIFSIY